MHLNTIASALANPEKLSSRAQSPLFLTHGGRSTEARSSDMAVERRRFLPPWDIEEANKACFIVRDNNGQALAFVYCEDEPGRRTAAKLLTHRIAVNATKLARDHRDRRGARGLGAHRISTGYALEIRKKIKR